MYPKDKVLKIGLILAAALLVVIAAITLANPSNPSAPVSTVYSSDWVKGSKEAKVILVEYSDFQCPACGAYYPVIKQLTNDMGNDFQFIYRHFPLRQIHKNADLAARTSEAAGRQNKFWEMHDFLFEDQKSWANSQNAKDLFIDYAQKLNLDMEKFKNDFDLKEVKEKVESDYQGGVKLGVNATPTFFLNGAKLQNPRSYEQFKSLLEEAISKNQ